MANLQIGDRFYLDWEICDIRKGRRSIVYIYFSQREHETRAAKTFTDEVFASDPLISSRFSKEVESWKSLPPHQNIVKARYVMEVEETPFLFMEYVSGDDLSQWIGTPRLTNDLKQVLCFAIQFCRGMSHALSNGITAHGNISPRNCLITEESILKVTDFCLNRALEASHPNNNRSGVSTLLEEKRGFFARIFAKPTQNASDICPYISPEHVSGNADTNVQTDIYSFGVMLFEMLSGTLPYDLSEWMAYIRKQKMPKIPYAGASGQYRNKRLLTKMDEIIRQCLAFHPEQRFANFDEVLNLLSIIYCELSGEPIPPLAQGRELEAHENLNHGAGLGSLGRCTEELIYIDRALTILPHSSIAWSNKGAALCALERYSDALVCLEHALTLDSRSAKAWVYKGTALNNLNRIEEALSCFDKAIEINSHFELAWIKKGKILFTYKGSGDSFKNCFARAVALNPASEIIWQDKSDGLPLQSRAAIGCYHKGIALASLGRLEDALRCFDRVVSHDPQWLDAWVLKGSVLTDLKRYHEALSAYDQALALNPQKEELLFKKAQTLRRLERPQEALPYLENVLRINPRNENALINIGAILASLKRYDEALPYSERALEANPKEAEAWFLKALLMSQLRRHEEAIECYKTAQQLGHADANTGIAMERISRWIKD